MTRLPAPYLTAVAEALLTALAVPQADAAVTAAYLVDADLDGVSTHGIGRLPNYLQLLQAGAVNPQPRLQLQQRRTATALLDADHALGQVAVRAALDWALPAAALHGSAWCAIRRCGHAGSLAVYLRSITDAGMIGIICGNSPPAVAPSGALRPLLGTNPLAVGVPLPGQPAFLLDMATSAVSRGTLLAAQRNRLPLPPGVALDAAGHPTTDPAAALDGALLPFGGAKGSGLALAIELLTVLSAGSALSAEMPSFFAPQPQAADLGMLIGVLDPAGFAGPAAAVAVAERFVTLLETAADDGGRLRLPGRRRHDHRQAALRDGLVLDPQTVAALHGWQLRLPAAAHPPLL